MQREFTGKWITDEEFCALKPRNVFFRQLERETLDCSLHRDRHILFRKRFCLASPFKKASLFITADDYYKLYVNGRFVGQGPAPAYHFRYNYNEIDLAPYLKEGENLIAVHTLYQGLINRVWQSGDGRHGLLLELEVDGRVVLASDESFLTQVHTGYTELGVCGYQTQFLEKYDASAPEVGFEKPDFDDGAWQNARLSLYDDHKTVAQQSAPLVFEKIAPKRAERKDGRLFLDFGSNLVGYLALSVKGQKGDEIIIRCAQELTPDGALRYDLRANCRYEEVFVLAEGESTLDAFDYKSFRYVELILPDSVTVTEAAFIARHYPFTLSATLRKEYAKSEALRAIWALCVNTQKYGVQEVIQDCMEREKGFYVGDGCYTALTHMILSGDDSMVRKLINDAFASCFITDTLVTCLNCSFMQEIAEYPLILVDLVLWHYRLRRDRDYLAKVYPKVVALLEAYRRDYEKEGLLRDLDKWCVVEWPQNFQHGYAVDIREGQVCHEAHISINAYYIEAVRAANKMADALSLPPYRDEAPLLCALRATFYDQERALFKDGEEKDHVSLVGNSFVYAFGLCKDEAFEKAFLEMLDKEGIASLSLFCTFPTLVGLARNGEDERLKEALLHEGAWRRMLREDATTTFEGWGKDTKWNTSLFHLTMSYAAVFLAEVDLKALFA